MTEVVKYDADGLPQVKRFSSLIEFLKLCKEGTRLRFFEVADAVITLEKFMGWQFEGDDDAVGYDSEAIVSKLRREIKVTQPNIDVDKCFFTLVPCDPLRVKKEMVQEESDDDHLFHPKKSMKLCEIDITGEEWEETATFDGDHVPEKVPPFA